MIKAILNSWPVLIPAVIYLFWFFLTMGQKKDVKVRDEYLIRQRQYMFYAIYAMGGIIVFMLVMFFIQVEPTPEKITTPLW